MSRLVMNAVDLSQMNTLVGLLEARAAAHPDKLAYTFLPDGEEAGVDITYGELATRARAVAATLLTKGAAGDRALMLFPSSLEFVVGFFGCLYAGIAAVPAYPPRRNQNLGRLQSIIDDCEPSIVMTTSKVMTVAAPIFEETPGLSHLQWACVDEISNEAAATWSAPAISAATIAFLQYTSGSTGNPKGVMVSHGNLLANEAMITTAFESQENDLVVSWLPLFHDMGLIGTTLQPLYIGSRAVFMSPASFLQKPVRWLQAVSDYKGTGICAPNFAYELCARQITPEQRATLDLSTLRVALSGAEVVRPETIDLFCDTFAECGFKRSSFLPTFGLAEATLFVAGACKETRPLFKRVLADDLSQNRVVLANADAGEKTLTLVSNGKSTLDGRVAIVDPNTFAVLPAGEVGEIWAAGPHIAQGYWKREEATKETFAGYTADGDGPFMRTGDLGCMLDGELYITGRQKEVIIIRGRNHYPQDIEYTVQQSHVALRGDAGAAFTVEINGEERLVVVQEVERKYRLTLNTEVVAAAVRQAVAETHELQVHTVVFIRPGSILKTSSGKIQRGANRKAFLENALEVISVSAPQEQSESSKNAIEDALKLEKQQWLQLPAEEQEPRLVLYLKAMIAREISESLEKIKDDRSLMALGIDSLQITQLFTRLRDKFEIDLELPALFEAEDFVALARTIANALRGERRAQLPPLERVDRETWMPLSFSQKRMWFLDKLRENNIAYNLPFALKTQGALDIQAAEKAFESMVTRHEVLRTRYIQKDGYAWQVIEPPSAWKFETIDLSYLKEPALGKAIQDHVYREARKPFNLEKGPVIRTQLLRLPDLVLEGHENSRAGEQNLLLITMHHIAADGFSLKVITDEISRAYEAELNDTPLALPDLPIQYADFAHWQKHLFESGLLDKQLHYWTEKLSGVPVLDFPTDRPRPPEQSFAGANHYFTIDKDRTAKLRQLSRSQGVTLYMTLLSGFKTLLHLYTNSADICVGTPIANRTTPELEKLIGFFVNTLGLRTDFSGNPSFTELMSRVRKTTQEAFANQDMPFERVVENLGIARDLSYSPVFQVMFVLQNSTINEEFNLAGVNVEELHTAPGTAKFDITLELSEQSGVLYGDLEYSTDLFDESTMVRFVEHLKILFDRVIADPALPVGQISILSDAEKKLIDTEYNNTELTLPLNDTLHGLFERQVQRTPDAEALVFGRERLTYQQVNERANRIANFLRSEGVGVGSFVGVCMPRSNELVISMLAILKAGAAYVPLDPNYPAERVAYMVEDTGAPIVLTHSSLLASLPDSHGNGAIRKLAVDTLSSTFERFEVSTPDVEVAATQLGYIIYTSGSTGLPKGVMISHANATAMVHWAHTVYSPQDLHGVLFSTSICFDLSVYEIFVTLSVGGKLIVAENILELPGLAAVAEVHLVNTVPSAIATLLRANQIPDGVRIINLAGEALPASLVDSLYSSTRVDRVYDLYGPSEDTTYSTYTLRLPQKPATIGRPISNTKAYLLNPYGQWVPPGIAGELYLAGTGVTQGYLNKPEMTAEKFLSNPFSHDALYARMYRTGDLVRHMGNGNLEYLGRIDHQVKVRGFRIELGEIQSVIGKVSGVREALVMTREERAGDKMLVAYVATHRERDALVPDIRLRIRERLPEYMMPSAFVLLDAFPLTPNGKVDRAALPAPALDELYAGEYIAPRNDTEARMARIWASLLGLEKVGVKSNFFELGGHSLLATQCVARIRDEFGIEVPVKALFTSPTIEDLCHALEAGERVNELTPPPVQRIARDGDLPLSFAQQRLWFLNQLETGSSDFNISTSYNMPAALRIGGTMDVKLLRKAFQFLIERHESLRTSFLIDDGSATQVIREPHEWFMDVRDISALDHDEREAEIIRLAQDEATRSFDLIMGPIHKARRIRLLRTRLLRTAADEHVLLLTMHHIISDGWSLNVLIRDVGEIYDSLVQGRASQLPPLEIQYADYAKWQREWMAGPVEAHQIAYWKQHLAGVPVLELPTDRQRPAVMTFNGDYEPVKFSAALTQRLNQLAHAQGATLFMTLLAGFYTLLYRYSGQEDICIGTPVANRVRPEFEQLIGCFVNSLALRAQLDGEMSFVDLMMQVQELTLNGYAHQDLPFERLVDALGVARNRSHSPLFQVMFTLQNASNVQKLSLPGLDLELLPSVVKTAKFDLTLNLTETANGLEGMIEYNTDLFDRETVHRLVNHFEMLLGAAVEHPQQTLAGLPMLTEAERACQLTLWNHQEPEFAFTDTLHQRFEAQVQRTPERVAIRFEDQSVTYRELNARANRLAHLLRARGVKANALVGVSMDRCPDMLVAILGVLKAGGAYVPVDPFNPEDRIRFILEDAAVQLLVTQQAVEERIPAGRYERLVLEALANDLAAQPDHDPASISGPDDRAYVIYTSGTTGKPKGVLIPHSNVIRLFTATDPWFGFNERDVWTLFHSFAFDFTVWEIWGALHFGGKLVVVPQQLAKSPDEFYELLCTEGVTVLNQTPSAFTQLIRVDERLYNADPAAIKRLKLRYVVFGGEALDFPALQSWIGRHGLDQPQLINMYGITETTVHVTYHRITPEDMEQRASLIGRPIPDLDVYVLDTHRQLVPVGVPGEMYVGGQGLSHGYLNRPELTDDRFVENPFGTRLARKGHLYERLYRTGDLARFLPDGTLEYLGRADDQVKIRGYRIELGEIVATINQYPGVSESVVLVREDVPGDKRLIAWLVAGETLDTQVLRAALRKQLPEYMVPSAYVLLAAMPLNHNGKINKGALPAPEGVAVSDREFVAPRNETEEILVEIWKDVLKLETLSVKDNFFDIGGHSLLATQVISRVRERFEIDIALSSLFEEPTIENLALQLLQAELENSDDSDMADLLAEIEGMSDEDLKNL
ncbi:Non-ribosomal peptide synthetase modules and related proteins [gamma proteobacterium HdN1]|nr:Non-ribosomal peptide synthetase modules and related proteins [gamma proteobacterium HdN1]